MLFAYGEGDEVDAILAEAKTAVEEDRKRTSEPRRGWSNGNGGLMCVLPLALWHIGPDDSLVREAHLQSLPTHAHARSQVACAFYVLIARGYLQKLPDPWVWADQRLEGIYRVWSDQQGRKTFLAELNVLRSFSKTDQPRGTGYVLDTIWSAR